MIIGDPSRFAIEYALSDEAGGVWRFGNICYWANGIRLGDFERTTSLRDVLFALEGIHSEAGKRQNPGLEPLDAVDALQRLEIALLGIPRYPTIDEERRAEEQEWARHQVMPVFDVFNLPIMFLIEGQVGRLLFRERRDGPVHEVGLEIGELDRVLAACCRALREP